MATKIFFLPWILLSFIILTLSCGRAWEITFLIPACAAIALAVSSLSPVTIIVVIFILCSCSIAAREVSLIVSATAIRPAATLSIAIIMTVFPSFSNKFFCVAVCLSNDIFLSAINFSVPMMTLRPSISPRTPPPVMEAKLFTATSLVFLFLA